MAQKKKATKKDFFKKYWFFLVVTLALVVFVVAYSVDAYKNRKIYVDDKKVEDKYALFSVDDEYYFADQLYEDGYALAGKARMVDAFTRRILANVYETTKEMDTLASNYTAYYLQQSSSQTAELLNYLKEAGYTNGLNDLKNYYIDYLKTMKMLTDYATNHYDDVTGPFLAENNYKAAYHILIKVKDVQEVKDDNGVTTHVANPTDEETAKLNQVLEKLKTEDFEDVAKEMSEDTSNELGGFLGYISCDKASEKFVAEFADAISKLESNVISDVITTQYGYHLILVKDITKEEIIENMETDTTIPLDLYENDNNIYVKSLLELCEKVNYTIINEDLKAQLVINEEKEGE